MTGTLAVILDLAGRLAVPATVLAFAMSAIAAMPLAAVRLPALAALLGLGGLAGLGGLPFWPVLAASVAGAFAADLFLFSLGRRHGARLGNVWPFDRHPGPPDAGSDDPAGCRGWRIVRGRLGAGFGMPVAARAGMTGMAAFRFAAVNVLSSLAWAAAHLLPAAAAGLALAGLGSMSKRLALAVVLFAIGLAVAVWLARATLRLGLRVLPHLQARLLAWAAHRDSRLQAVVARLAAPHHAEFRLFVILNLILLVMIGGFLAILGGIATGDPLFRFDAGVSRFLQALRTPWFDTVMIGLTSLGDWAVTLPVAIVAIAVLLLARRWKLAAGLAFGMASTMAFVQGVKLLVQEPRPIPIYQGPDAWSFPSGHATLTATMYGILALLAFRFAAPVLRQASVAICAGLIAAICFSRVYLAAHWPSDVIAGLMFGAAVTAAFALVFREESLPRGAAHRLLGGCALVLLLLGGWHVGGKLPDARAFYAAQPAAPLALATPWREGGWQELPRYRVDLNGETEEPLLLQWGGDAASLRAALQAQGWMAPPDWSIAAIDGFVQAQADPLSLPALPMLDQGRLPAVTMARAATLGGVQGRFVLRTWARLVTAAEGPGLPVLLGSLSFEAIRHPLGQLTLALATEHLSCNGDALLLPLPGATATGISLPAADEGCGGSLVLAGP